MGNRLDLDPQKLETLRMLYPIFKKEVFDRRERMMRISVLATAFLILTLALLLSLDTLTPILSESAWAFVIGIVLFTGLTLHHMKQHSRRHAQAKRAVIDIEEALRLFDPGLYLADRALYPENWKARPPNDPSLLLYSLSLTLMAAVVVLALLLSA